MQNLPATLVVPRFSLKIFRDLWENLMRRDAVAQQAFGGIAATAALGSTRGQGLSGIGTSTTIVVNLPFSTRIQGGIATTGPSGTPDKDATIIEPVPDMFQHVREKHRRILLSINDV